MGRNKHLTIEGEKDLVKLYKEGIGVSVISKKYGMSRSVIYTYLKRLGIPRCRRKEAPTCRYAPVEEGYMTECTVYAEVLNIHGFKFCPYCGEKMGLS